MSAERVAAGGACSACTRARALKLLLAALVAVVFLEYFSGVLMENGRAVTLYTSSNASALRNQPLQWPKRTHGRHCFDDHVGTERNQQTVPSNLVNNTPPTHIGSSPAFSIIPERNDIVVNVHNSTLRSQIFNNETVTKPNKTVEISEEKVNLTFVSASDVSVNNSIGKLEVIDPPSPNERVSGGEQDIPVSTPEPGCNVPCPLVPPGLVGPITVNLTEITLKDLENSHLDVEEGGRYAPRNCRPHDRVAIIIPYRDRESHLAIFLNNIHPFLMKQQIDYQIFIIEQKGKAKFNRASLMNVGFVEGMSLRPWDCFIFHDVDLLPLDDRNLYTCPQQPRHLSAAIDKFQFKLPYKTIFGGVSALTTEQFQTVNGFSNSFWGWGGEDDDMANRISYHNYHISRYPMSIARYTMLDHEKEKPNQERYNLLMKGKRLFNTDGLNSLQYTLVESRLHRFYTQLLVELHPPS